MINRERTGLNIFERFRKDLELPKFKEKSAKKPKNSWSSSFIARAPRADFDPQPFPLGNPREPVLQVAQGSQDEGYWDGIPNPIAETYIRQHQSFMTAIEHTPEFPWIYRKVIRMVKWFGAWLHRKKHGKNYHVAQHSIEDFFLHVKNTREELRKIGKRYESYRSLVEKAEANGQKALAEKLLAEADVIGLETQMFAAGLKQAISEEMLIKFVMESPRGLRLDWIGHFARIIPDEVLGVKKKCDEMYIFDNYVILHYDPEGKSFAQTEEERKRELARKRDPILFGVLEKSRKLYFIGDWIDEYCDLTWDQLVDALDKQEVEKAYITETVTA